jgi:7-keto-8-aminopelargonate synthetase-like enzyme
MSRFDEELGRRLTAIREQGLHRELRRVDSPQGTHIEIGGKTLLNFSSNDYLGLANHPALKDAAIRAVETFGAGSGSARLICGSLAPHHELEEALAAFKGTESALTFSSGYATALGTIPALVGKEDVIIVDKLVHACIVDAARLSGAKLRVFRHNDLEDLKKILKWSAAQRRRWSSSFSLSPNTLKRELQPPRALIVTESIFSMDGDVAPLAEIVALKKKYGAWLMVDEAHSTGLYGPHRRGLAEELGVAGQIEIQMGTLGKALGASGGYICGSRKLINFLINRARSFIFSTAPVPATAAAARAGIQLVQSTEGQRLHGSLMERVQQCRTGVAPVSGFFRETTNEDRRDACPTPSAIIPLTIGDEAKAVALASELRERGFFVPAIRYPTVARGSARLRITLTAAHASNDVAELISALLQVVNRKS